jgi:hypothetical protein
MIHNSYSMPWYLWLGIVGLSLSVLIPAVIRMIKNRVSRVSRADLPWDGYDIDEGWDKALRSIQKPTSIPAVTAVPDSHLGLLTPLQLDVISLAIELAKFSKEMHERPDFALPKFQDSVAGTTARIEFLQRRNAIIESTYRHRFGDRLSQIVDRLGSEGVKRNFLDSRVAGDIHESIEAQTTANHLIGAAFELNGLYLYPPRTFTTFDLDTMSGDEMARRIREEPGFAETMERYRMKNLIVRD